MVKLLCCPILFGLYLNNVRYMSEFAQYRGVRSVGPVRRAGRFCSGLRGRRRTYLTILKRAWSANFKMVWYATSEAGAKPARETYGSN
jgi:hypothetical protein